MSNHHQKCQCSSCQSKIESVFEKILIYLHLPRLVSKNVTNIKSYVMKIEPLMMVNKVHYYFFASYSCIVILLYCNFAYYLAIFGGFM